MNAPLSDMRHDKIDRLAAEYSRAGFDVVKEPAPALLPFDLDTHRPDLLAKKGNEGLIVDVRTSFLHVSVERLQSVAEEVSRHPGWRFLLVTLDDVGEQAVPTTVSELLTWEQIFRYVDEVDVLIGQQALVPALLHLGSVFEAALRRRAIDQNVPVERFPELALLKDMYSLGEISVYQIDTLEEFLQKRNRVAHGANDMPDLPAMAKWQASVREVLSNWKQEMLA
jgi:hypothetical protein